MTRKMIRNTTRKIVTMRRPNTLIRVWRSTGQPGTPLIGHWVKSANLRSGSAESPADEVGGLHFTAL